MVARTCSLHHVNLSEYTSKITKHHLYLLQQSSVRVCFYLRTALVQNLLCKALKPGHPPERKPLVGEHSISVIQQDATSVTAHWTTQFMPCYCLIGSKTRQQIHNDTCQHARPMPPCFSFTRSLHMHGSACLNPVCRVDIHMRALTAESQQAKHQSVYCSLVTTWHSKQTPYDATDLFLPQRLEGGLVQIPLLVFSAGRALALFIHCLDPRQALFLIPGHRAQAHLSQTLSQANPMKQML